MQSVWFYIAICGVLPSIFSISITKAALLPTLTVAYLVSFLNSLESPDLQFSDMFFLGIFTYLPSEQPLQVILSFAIAEVLEFMYPGYFYSPPKPPPPL